MCAYICIYIFKVYEPLCGRSVYFVNTNPSCKEFICLVGTSTSRSVVDMLYYNTDLNFNFLSKR